MNRENAPGLFIASDARTQYAEDILTALALPAGSVLQLRYDDQYLSQPLRQSCVSGESVGRRFMLSFMSAMSSGRHFVIPVRFCRVVDTQVLGGVWVFRVAMEQYPALDGWPTDSDALEELGSRLQSDLSDGNDAPFSFARHSCPLVVGFGDNDAQSWNQIARRLSAVPAFGARQHFLKIDPPTLLTRSSALAADDTGTFTLTEENNHSLAVTYWAAEHDAIASSRLELSVWGEGAALVSPSQVPLKARYDSYEVMFRSLSISSPSMCRFDISITQDSDTSAGARLTAGAQLTFRLAASRRRMLARVSVSALAALLLAVPSMLGPDTPSGVRITIAGLGAVALGITSSGVGTWGRK
ncbi:hypothetical protein [Streptomyces sp. CRN 30]|uniref:hypothetical protein n=1 Tax=Streptomyces sp. CRN 30 TaxID=3075613 RepID=UPI002A7EE724|nr:hypothetical protein [Streptomyces sp. CRN 30]